MNCKNKELFQSYYIIIPFCWPTCFGVKPQPGKPMKRCFFVSFFFFFCCPHQHFPTSSAPPLRLSISLSPFTFVSSFFLQLWPWRCSSCVCSATLNSEFLFFSPSLPPFSLASPVSLPWDSRPLCSRYRPIDFGRERKYHGHDSPCMNLMIPVLSAPSFSMEKQADKAHAIFISLSSGMSVIRSTDKAN